VILPSKHLSQDRALLTIGAHILQNLSQPKTVSALWEELPQQSESEKERYSTSPLSYDQFVLAMDFLFLLDAVELSEGILMRKTL